MELEGLLMAASAVFGFATGLWIARFVLELMSLAVAFSVSFILQLNGFGFGDGSVVLVGVLLSSQVAYFGGVLIRARRWGHGFPSHDLLDNGPDARGEGDIRCDQQLHD